MPKLSSRRAANTASLPSSNSSAPLPPENRMRHVGITPRQLRHHGQPLGRFVERHVVARRPTRRARSSRPARRCRRARRAPRPRAGSAARAESIRALPTGESPSTASTTMLADHQPPAGAGETRGHQQHAEQPDRDHHVGWIGEEAEHLGEDEEHATRLPSGRPATASSSTPRNAPWSRRSSDRGRGASRRARPRRRSRSPCARARRPPRRRS